MRLFDRPLVGCGSLEQKGGCPNFRFGGRALFAGGGAVVALLTRARRCLLLAEIITG